MTAIKIAALRTAAFAAEQKLEDTLGFPHEAPSPLPADAAEGSGAEEEEEEVAAILRF